MGPAVVLGHLREAEGPRGQLPLWRQLLALPCGRTRSQKPVLPAREWRPARPDRQRVCWAQEVVSAAVGGRCFRGAGVLGPGHRRQWDSASRVLWPGCTSSSSPPFWKEGFRQAPAQADSAFLSQECPPPLGPQCRGGCRRVGFVLPPGSWTRRPVLFPGSDFNTETWRPSPFICKDGPSFPSHCSPGPWGAAGVLCAGQGASGTPGRAPVTIAINRHSVTPRAGIAVAVGCVYS